MASSDGGYGLRIIRNPARLQTVVSEPGRGGMSIIRRRMKKKPRQWLHIVQVFAHNGIDWSDSELYVNGELAGEYHGPYGGSFYTQNALRIGSGFEGKVGKVTIFRNPLGPKQVEALYGEGTGTDE